MCLITSLCGPTGQLGAVGCDGAETSFMSKLTQKVTNDMRVGLVVVVIGRSICAMCYIWCTANKGGRYTWRTEKSTGHQGPWDQSDSRFGSRRRDGNALAVRKKRWHLISSKCGFCGRTLWARRSPTCVVDERSAMDVLGNTNCSRGRPRGGVSRQGHTTKGSGCRPRGPILV